MRGEARGGLTPYTPPRETLVVTSSRPNSEALAECMVLAHPHVAFHPCMCGLHRGAAAVVIAPIDYFLYTDVPLHYIATLTLLSLLHTSSGNDP
jgi:hypothetical protein